MKGDFFGVLHTVGPVSQTGRAYRRGGPLGKRSLHFEMRAVFLHADIDHSGNGPCISGNRRACSPNRPGIGMHTGLVRLGNGPYVLKCRL